MKPGQTRLQSHLARWKGCRLCPLHKVRQRVVLARGQVPCQVLFVGESPGDSEDSIGYPFVGPAGKLLDRIIFESERVLGHRSKKRPTYAMTNLVACIPLRDEGGKMVQPPKESIAACAPRLDEFLRIARPQVIVAVGQLARDVLERRDAVLGWEIHIRHIVHPAAILQADVSRRGLMYQQAIVDLVDALEEL